MTANEYIRRIKSECGADNIYIFGAGKFAKGIFNLCKENDIKISAFVVTDPSSNPNMIFDTPVYGVCELNNKVCNSLFLICVKPKWNEEIQETLFRIGAKRIVEAPQDISTFADPIRKFERPVLEITPKIGCSVHCRYCPQDILCRTYFKMTDKSTMSFEEFKYCIDKTPDDLIIEFAGFVEPFLNPESVQMMQYANQIGRDVSLFTTLVGATPMTFEKIKKIPFFEVVLHVPDKDGYANITMDENYYSVLRCFLEGNKNDGSPFVDKANCQSEPHPDVLNFLSNNITVYSDLNDRAGSLESADIVESKKIEGRVLCSRAKNVNHFILLPNGSLALCCSDFGLHHIVGNLFEQTWEEIIHGEELNKIKRCMADANAGSIICRNCVYAIQI